MGRGDSRNKLKMRRIKRRNKLKAREQRKVEQAKKK